MTSAATAQAAWMAAQIQAIYPEAWPETIRGLLVHSAEWTKTMKEQFLDQKKRNKDYEQLIRVCGFGVPNLQIALECMRNSLTLISQKDIQPFKKEGYDYVTKDMHLYKLPWPEEILEELGEKKIFLRVTLSYFIEPNPIERGYKKNYTYASYGLRFDLKKSGVSENEFHKSINKQERKEGEKPDPSKLSKGWILGEKLRNRGSIHSDIWEGSAIDLVDSNIIGIYPTKGWWSERPQNGRWNKKARYSLIVSLHTEETGIDIYTPVFNQVKIKTKIPTGIKR
jgi:hypothetical protein